jgi:hypothetical protein
MPWQLQGKSNWIGRHSTVDLLVLNSLNQLLLLMLTLLTFSQNSRLNEEINCTELLFPAAAILLSGIYKGAKTIKYLLLLLAMETWDRKFSILKIATLSKIAKPTSRVSKSLEEILATHIFIK